MPSPSSPRGGLHVSLWVVQALLGLAFLGAGFMKLTTPVDQLVANGMNWVTYTPEPLVRFIGLSELLGAIGLVAPSATRIQPRLTALAALGLVVVMVLAAITHATHGEAAVVPVNVVLGGLAGFVAWGRGVKAPIPGR